MWAIFFILKGWGGGGWEFVKFPIDGYRSHCRGQYRSCWTKNHFREPAKPAEVAGEGVLNYEFPVTICQRYSIIAVGVGIMIIRALHAWLWSHRMCWKFIISVAWRIVSCWRWNTAMTTTGDKTTGRYPTAAFILIKRRKISKNGWVYHAAWREDLWVPDSRSRAQ